MFYPDRRLTVHCYKKFIFGPPADGSQRVKSVFLYSDLLWVFYHSALRVDQPLPFVVCASYRVRLAAMLRRAARMLSWAVPSGRPSLGRRLSYRSGVSLAPVRRRPSVSIPPLCYVLTAGRLYGLTLFSIRLCGACVRTLGLWLSAQDIAVVTGAWRTCGPSLQGRPDLYSRCHVHGLFESVGC